MRLLIYGTFLVLCSVLIRSSFAESRSYKKIKDDEDNGVERPSKYKGDKKYIMNKYKLDVDEDSEEDYKMNKYQKDRAREGEKSFTSETYSKGIKKTTTFVKGSNESQSYKKDKRRYDIIKNKIQEGSGKRFGINKLDVHTVEDTDESHTKRIDKANTRYKKNVKETPHDITEDDSGKYKKFSNRHAKDNFKDNDEEDSEEVSNKIMFSKKSKRQRGEFSDESDEDSQEKVPKREFRRKIRVRVADSSEDDYNETTKTGDERRTCQRNTKRGKKGEKGCSLPETENGIGDKADEPFHKKKIKYSIKFAHEKQKINPNEDDNIMKIHRGAKKSKYQDDDDDDSSEENTHPKRLHFLDDDDD